VTAILGDDRPDGPHVPDLMTQRLLVIAVQQLLAMAADCRFAVVDGIGVIDKGTLNLGVPVLIAGFVAGRRLGWGVFEGRWVRRGRLGGVGGVLVEALLEFSDLLLQVLQLPLVLLDEGQDRHLCCRRELVPKLSRDGWPRAHAADLQTELTYQGPASDGKRHWPLLV
jgi:hypothetical protein